MRLTDSTAYRCVHDRSKEAHVRRSSRKLSIFGAVVLRKTMAGMSHANAHGSGPSRIRGRSRTTHRTSSVLQCADHTISRPPRLTYSQGRPSVAGVRRSALGAYE